MTNGRTVLHSGLVFGEGPRWHNERLWVSDMHGHKLWTISLDGSAKVVAEFDDLPSGTGFLPDDTVLVAAIRSQKLYSVDSSGAIALYADLSFREGWLNDMIVDGNGRAYVGYRTGRFAQGKSEGDDKIILVHPDGRIEDVASGILGPNGIVITPDGRTMIVAMSFGKSLVAYDINDDGSLAGERVWADLAQTPDGICLDEESAVWVGHPRARRFVRVAEGGEVLDEIICDDEAIACMLGGADGRTLFMVVAEISREDLTRFQEPGSELTSKVRTRIEMQTVSAGAAGWPN